MIRRHLAGFLLCTLLAADASAAVTLPAPLRDMKPELRSVGTASLHWFGWHVYDIALHTPEAAYTTNSTAALSIRYHISIKHHRLLETTLKEWQRMNKGQEDQRQRWIKQLDPLWPDLKPGDCLTAFRHRDGATQFYFGDRLLGEVADPAFGPAFFDIWLDAKCRYPNVRDDLLGVNERQKKGHANP